ncbi:DUF1801 domain-containing protein [Ulvibacter antarcticus]|uniref:Uncharacterized protein DUF1801 n=1 Tax=Ulvibacter antarcticus TaxID=442714 RepID=A0A3L9Z2H6_9FLAO|nr:DUF1801 domain-containing protein [Ulvibacter antarcticus]RMA66207.1 uncharacterized protein DUF1801 [Ulvibacter antarcticus]
MYTPITQQNEANVTKFLEGFQDEDRYPDFEELMKLMETISEEKPKMWGSSIIGFGKYTYKGKSSSGEWFKIGFAPRKQNISIYAISGFEKEADLMSTLGKHKTGKGCLYIKRLNDIDKEVLIEFLKRSWIDMKKW